jgi:tRNA dimethylallyltransferase
LGLQVARLFRGEIVNADSRQVYRLMDIGTAKPTLQERSAVPHHLFDIIYPDQDFGLAQYQEAVSISLKGIQERNRVPILVGGSGQYVWATLEGWTIPRIPPDRELRQKLELEAFEQGVDGLYRQLQEIDPLAARKIDKRNIRRVVRALEVTLLAGKPISSLQIKNVPDYNIITIGLTAARKELYRRTDCRVDQMMQQGLIAETENLIARGYDFSLPSMSSIGYKQIGMMLRGEISGEEAVKQVKTANHRFVRHQYAWFKLEDKRIHWFDVSGDFTHAVIELVSNWFSATIASL